MFFCELYGAQNHALRWIGDHIGVDMAGDACFSHAALRRLDQTRAQKTWIGNEQCSAYLRESLGDPGAQTGSGAGFGNDMGHGAEDEWIHGMDGGELVVKAYTMRMGRWEVVASMWFAFLTYNS